ncbi:MAG: alpha/beta hydrolase [Bacteroidota bacterium]
MPVLFDFEVLKLHDDYEGEVTATLIKSKHNTAGQSSVLYIHGFFDYFFHPHLAELFHLQRLNFYALDLRKCGRSILPHQHAYYCKDIGEYFEEIDTAIGIIGNDYNSKLILLGHSMGGLISSAYMNSGRKRDMISALVLNSPLFDFNEPSLVKAVVPCLSKIISAVFPFGRIRDHSLPIYARSLHKDHQGEWNFNPEWKLLDEGYPVYFSWLNAVSKGFSGIRKHSSIAVPVLVLHASHSVKSKVWDKSLLEADGVLNFRDIIRISKRLGKNVTIIGISQGMHDIFLSMESARMDAFSQMIDWLDKNELH